MTAPTGLAALSRRSLAEQSTVSVPRPQFRWRTRVLLPLVVLAGAAAVLAWSARDALWPAIEVRVVPVVAKPRSTDAAGAGNVSTGGASAAAREHTLVQAPGWIEPAPFAVTVAALTEGVVKEVLFLEGQRVEAGDVLARLVDDDAQLSLRRAEAELAERTAAVAVARAEESAAAARAAAVRDDVERKRPLAADGSVSGAELARLTLQLRAVEADIASASAAIAAAEAAQGTQRVAVEQAALALVRTEIRAPTGGVVLSRSIEPGTRLTMAGPGPGESHEAGVARIYDPLKLQVRVDVPLADAAKVDIGTRARIVTEALPDTTFHGVVTRVVHEANIQRNTVQFKVSIDDPHAALKPEMLVRVRLLGAGAAADGVDGADGGTDSFVLLLPQSVLLDVSGDRAAAWMIAHDPRRGTTAVRRALSLGADHGDGLIEIVSGASATDRAIASPPTTLTEGTRIRVLGEAAAREGEAP